MHVEVPITLYARACTSLSLCVPMTMWICVSDFDHGFFCLGTSLHLSQYRGCCSHRALAGQCQQVPTLGGYGGGVAAPSRRERLPGQEGCSFSSFTPSPSSVPFPSAPPIQAVSGHLTTPSPPPPRPILSEPSLPPPPLPSLPTPPCSLLPAEHPAWKASVPPLAPVRPGPNAVCFPLQVGAGAPCRQ